MSVFKPLTADDLFDTARSGTIPRDIWVDCLFNWNNERTIRADVVKMERKRILDRCRGAMSAIKDGNELYKSGAGWMLAVLDDATTDKPTPEQLAREVAIEYGITVKRFDTGCFGEVTLDIEQRYPPSEAHPSGLISGEIVGVPAHMKHLRVSWEKALWVHRKVSPYRP